ncbi:MAG: GMC family oxidoreductase [Acetobacteraceae bacterium]
MSTTKETLEADFVVVGAGSAGCVMAARLSEDRASKVVLLEAGGEDKSMWIHIPLGFGKTFADGRVNWCFETESDPGAAGRRIFWPRGKVLGGSSSINGMVYIRGQHEDFDLWRQLGNTGWSASDVLPYFKRAEDQTRGEDDWHATGGPLSVSDVQDGHPICEAFIRACVGAGHRRNDDFNGQEQDGVGYHQTTTRNGKRCSTAVGYLHPARNRTNLRVVTGAHTQKILFEGKRAVGVIYRQDGHDQVVKARKEVILCGGAIGSPQMLMLSGVGPQEQLAAHGIPVVHHLPGVGQSLQDHYSAAIKLKCAFPITVNDVMMNPLKMLWTGLEYLVMKKGALTVITAEVAIFARTRPELATPDVTYSIAPFSAERPQDGLHKWSGFTLLVYQLRPESRGEIVLRSANPFDSPAIRPNYLATETDRRTIVDGLRMGRQLLASPHMQTYIASEYMPGPSVQTDSQLLEYARNNGGTVFHPTSTCKMGIDPMAVVDPTLKVYGIEGLRVVDASVMPAVISGNTNAPTIMIAEKAADMIRGKPPLAAAA